MKRIFVLFAFILTATFAQAQSNQTTETPAERAHTQALKMKKQLGLSDEQTASIEAIIIARHNEIDVVNADANKTQEQKDSDIAVIRSNKEKEIQAVLTPDQIVRYNEIKTQREERQKAAGGH
jgi:hypothetical protein